MVIYGDFTANFCSTTYTPRVEGSSKEEPLYIKSCTGNHLAVQYHSFKDKPISLTHPNKCTFPRCWRRTGFVCRGTCWRHTHWCRGIPSLCPWANPPGTPHRTSAPAVEQGSRVNRSTTTHKKTKEGPIQRQPLQTELSWIIPIRTNISIINFFFLYLMSLFSLMGLDELMKMLVSFILVMWTAKNKTHLSSLIFHNLGQ